MENNLSLIVYSSSINNILNNVEYDLVNIIKSDLKIGNLKNYFVPYKSNILKAFK